MTTLLARPELGADTLTARPYQDEALQAVRTEFAKGVRSTLVIHPTGLGKTLLASKIARKAVEKGNRVLFLAHRGELIHQTASMMERVGIMAGVEMADSYARSLYEPDVVIASVQTMQRKRLASWEADTFGLIICDEAHHFTAKSFRAVPDHFARAKVLGLTATPDRADEDNLTAIFQTVAHELTLWDGMTAPPPGPYLCRLKFVQLDVQIDLRDIKTTAGDYSPADLEDKIRPLVDTLANAIRQEIGERQTIVFTPDVGSAQAMATAFDSLGLRAEWVAGDSPDRDAIVKRYKDGETQVIVNCMILTEGFDSPETSAIVLCRPTKSRSLYSQMVGRGTRLKPGGGDCLLIDFDYLTVKHDLVRPADLFDRTDADPEVVNLANRKAKDKPGMDLLDLVEQARAEVKERQVLRIKAHEREIKARSRVSYDPLAVADVLGIVNRSPANASHQPAGGPQVEALERRGIVGASSMSRRQAKKMLDILNDRRSKDLATYKQVSWLVAKGVDPVVARVMPFAEASARLDQLFNKRA